MINIYCDESCHLEKDPSDLMFLGAVSCDKRYVKNIAQDLRKIKEKHHLKKNYELKWTKVSKALVCYYDELITYFFDNPKLQFRCVIAEGKKLLDNEAFHQTYDDWYYKMYYLLLSKMIDPTEEYNVYIDIKDTNGGAKVKKLKTILDNYLYKFSDSCLNKIQIVTSDQLEILQLCDFLIGIVSYKNRFLNALSCQSNIRNLSETKVYLCDLLAERSGRPLTYSTPLTENKFNLFVWRPRREGD